MRGARTMAAGVVTWCAVVVVVAAIVWSVISHAGAGLTPTAASPDTATGSLPVPPPDHRPQVRPGTRLTPRTTPEASASASPGVSSAPTTSGSATPTAGPTTSAPPAGPTTQRRSWSGGAGHVVAQCRGAEASLVSTYPNTGWRYQVLDRGPQAVRVRFRRLQNDDGFLVVAQCVSGAPRFTLSGGGKGDD